jgi:putative DNA primase/helicase
MNVTESAPGLPELRDHIRLRRRFLADALEEVAALALDGDLLRVIPSNDIDIRCLRYLNDNRALIGELASEYLARKITVRVEVSSNGTGASADATTAAAGSRDDDDNGGRADAEPTKDNEPNSPRRNRQQRSTSRSDYRTWHEAIASAALRRCPAILQDWLPAGRINRREFEAGNADGASGSSLKINLDTGRWKDFASPEPGGNNLIGLYARIRSLEYREAARELAAQFGIEGPKPLKLVISAWEPITPIPDFAPVDERGGPIIPTRSPNFATAEVVGVWCYRDRDGQPLMYRVRLERSDGKKDVLPLTFCRNRESGETAWRSKDLPAPRPLYGLDQLTARPKAQVLVVEGEKTADAARRLLPEWVVITWPGGTNRVSNKYTDWSPGTKAIAILAAEFNGRCQVVQPDPAWRKSWDLADAEAEGWDTARVLQYLEAHLITPEKRIEERAEVNISSGDLDEQTQVVWQAIQQVNDPAGLLTSASGLVIVDRDVFGRARRQIATIERLRHWLTARLAFKRFSPDGLVATKPSDTLLTNILVYNRPPLGFVRRITEIPILAPDGRLIAKEGFDAASGIYYLPSPDLAELEINSEPPSRAEIKTALALIEDLTADFPFVAGCDRAHAMAFMLLPIVRLTILGRTPLFRFEAPQPRTGKTLLARRYAAHLPQHFRRESHSR